MIRLGEFLFRYRNRIFPTLIVAGLLVAHPRYPLGDPDLDIALDFLGLAIGLAGQSLRVLTIGYEYIRRGGRDGRVYADELVTGGVFAHSRNPLYVGNILMFLGVVVMINDPWLYAAGVPAILIFYRAIVAAEEHYLANRFGSAFADYRQRVNRWWPALRGFTESIGGMRFNWRRVLLKEYNTTFAWLLAMLAVQVWQARAVGVGNVGTAIDYHVYSLLAAALLLAYLLVRICKKKRLLTT